MTAPRWHAVALYQTQSGPVDVHHDVEELEELQDLIERGPNWYALIEIRITLNHGDAVPMTVEEAETA